MQVAQTGAGLLGNNLTSLVIEKPLSSEVVENIITSWDHRMLTHPPPPRTRAQLSFFCRDFNRGGVQGAIERAAPTLAAAHAISRAVQIPVMAASGLSDITAPMALAAGARGVGVGSAGEVL